MRRHHLTSGVIAALGSILVAAPCGSTGPGPKTFATGALVIPMDNCYQKRDGTSAPGGQTQSCNAASDDGIFRAYGLVYFLLKHNVTVYWAIDGATPKTAVTGADVVVPAPTTGISVVKKYNWSTGNMDVYSPAFPVNTSITYIGGPFIIDPGDKATVLNLFQTSADFAQFKSTALVDVHEVQVGFTASQVRPLIGPPPKVAILFSYAANTSASVMVGYAKAGGFDWACHGACTTAADCKAGGACVASVCQDCAGGISKADPTCTQTYVQNQFAITVNDGPGTVYDILCDKDFLPDYTATPPDFSKATLLAQGPPGPYKLLWAPHWETPSSSGSLNTVPNPSAAIGTAPRNLADWLQCLANFVNAGNNIFAECHAVVTLEGGVGSSGTEYGLPVTRFQTTAGFLATNVSPLPPAPPAIGSFPTRFLQPPHPNVQIGDFVYQDVTGSIEYFYPDRSSTPASTYRAGVQRLMSQNSSGAACSPACTGDQICVGGTCTLPNDVGTTIQVGGTGNVAYLGGHNYAGQTAGTRIVLNTLFNLGFGCADPNTVCNTGKLGICATGHLKCAPSGGFQCVQDNLPVPEICGNGLDDDCDGVVDNGCTPTVCNPGDTRPCFAGASGCTDNGSTFTCLGATAGCVDNHNGTFTCASSGAAICRLGHETCSASGVWGACSGEVHPGPEVCNGKDDNCNGATDEGSNCYPGYACTNGVCLPGVCGVEVNVCPVGFTCQASGTCQAIPCPSTPCTTPGQVCINGSCQDPCQTVTCGPGAACSGGSCTGGACYSFGCPTGEICTGGQCIADPCAGSNCPTGTFCRGGDCVRSCVYVKCGTGQVCNRDGFCETPACDPPCVAGQVCTNASCVPDPACQNVPCGAGQVCRAGACGDAPCANVTCPVGTCVEDQCQGELPPGQAPTNGKKSGCGCSSAGGVEVLSLGLVALMFGTRRRRRSPGGPAQPGKRASRPVGRGRRSLLGLAALIVLLGVSGCSCGSETCRTGQTKCGGTCVSLDSSASNCGVCGNVCPSQWSCSGGSCAFPTGNPFLKAISPDSTSPGATVAIDFTGSGFQSGMTARFKGAGLDTEQPVTVTDASTAKLAALDLTSAVPGTVEVRLLNPQRLVSNAQTLTLLADARLVTVDKASIPQDAPPTTLALTGDKFATGITASLTLVKQWDGTVVTGATPLNLATTYGDAQHASAALTPGTLAIGIYDLKVQNPNANPSNALKLSINSGTPSLTALSTDCALTNSTLTGAAIGTYLYPTTVIDVQGKIGTPTETFSSVVVQSPVCGTDALAQCSGSPQQISVSQDLTGVPAGAYCVRAMNPGPLFSGYKPFCIGSCPTTCNHACP